MKWARRPSSVLISQGLFSAGSAALPLALVSYDVHGFAGNSILIAGITLPVAINRALTGEPLMFLSAERTLPIGSIVRRLVYCLPPSCAALFILADSWAATVVAASALVACAQDTL